MASMINDSALAQAVTQLLSQLETGQLNPAQQAQLQQLLAASSFIGRTLLQQPALLSQLTDNEQLMNMADFASTTLAGCEQLDETALFRLLRQVRNARLCSI